MERRYQNHLRLLNQNTSIHPDNRAKIIEFLTHCKAKELRKARQVFYLQHLTTIATILANKRFTDTSKQDVEAIFAKLSERKGREGRKLEDGTQLTRVCFQLSQSIHLRKYENAQHRQRKTGAYASCSR